MTRLLHFSKGCTIHPFVASQMLGIVVNVPLSNPTSNLIVSLIGSNFKTFPKFETFCHIHRYNLADSSSFLSWTPPAMSYLLTLQSLLHTSSKVNLQKCKSDFPGRPPEAAGLGTPGPGRTSNHPCAYMLLLHLFSIFQGLSLHLH